MGTEAIEIINSKALTAIFDNKPNSCFNQENEFWYEEEIDEDLKWSFALNRFDFISLFNNKFNRVVI